MKISAFALGVALALNAGFMGCSSKQTIWTQHQDDRRGGWYPEHLLTVDNVGANSGKNFGKKFSLSVDGDIYAQPLVVNGVQIPGHGALNVVFVATAKNSVYAFDADSPGPPLWHAQLGPFLPGPPNADPKW